MRTQKTAQTRALNGPNESYRRPKGPWGGEVDPGKGLGIESGGE